MCRLIMAVGPIRASLITSAALAMSTGRGTSHDGPTAVHPNGWGVVWRDDQHRLRDHRDPRSIEASLTAWPHDGLHSDFIAVHVRHATLSSNIGPQFCHPLTRSAVGAGSEWRFMHNGFMPTVHRCLGLASSTFDSQEYFDWLVPAQASSLDHAEVISRLELIPEPYSSGNAFVINAESAHVVHWSAPHDTHPRYFTMWRTRLGETDLVASEVVADLAPAQNWTPLPAQSVTRFDLNGASAPSRARKDPFACRQ